MTDLDRDRSNGRTAVQQCWDYLNALPGCPWGIVSNFATIRLYHREKGTLAYQEFTLPEMGDRERFNEFYFLFEGVDFCHRIRTAAACPDIPSADDRAPEGGRQRTIQGLSMAAAPS